MAGTCLAITSDNDAPSMAVSTPRDLTHRQGANHQDRNHAGCRLNAGQPACGPSIVAWRNVALTDPQRVIDRDSGTTRENLLQHAERVAPWLLRELAGRPVCLVQAAQGVDAQVKLMGEATRGKWLAMRRLNAGRNRTARLAIDDAEGLLHAVLGDAIELRTAHTRCDASSQASPHPDRLVLDLDPGPGTPWPAVLQAAALVRAVLEEFSLTSCLKTSGARGLHLVVPVVPAWPAAALLGVSEALVAHLGKRFPERFATRAADAAKRVFVDHRRNARDAVLVVAYSVRARPGLGVSVPVRWNELCGLSGGDHWTVQTLPQRLADIRREDPWAGYGERPSSIDELVRAMGLPPLVATR
jgi:bifunctional non-homologous end joining protein LigD